MRIPKLSKTSQESSSYKTDVENIFCLFCSHPVKESSISRYETHLIQRHNLEKHVQQTILDTFNGHKRSLEKKNDELYSLNSVKDLLASLDRINKDKTKIIAKDSKCDDLINSATDVMNFIEQSEKEVEKTRTKILDLKVEDVSTLSSPPDPPITVENSTTDKKTGLSKDSTQRYSCDDCEKDFNRPSRLKFHKTKVHSVTNLSKDRSQVDVDVETSYTNENKDDWSEYIIFKCQVCHKEFKGVNYEGHITSHNLSKETYQVKYQKEDSFYAAKYQCLVCFSKLEWKKSSIESHFSGHKLSLEQYFVLYEKPIKKQIENQLNALEKESATNLQSSSGNEESNKSSYENIKKAECGICKREFSTNFKLQRHVKSEHLESKGVSNSTTVKIEKAEIKSDPDSMTPVHLTDEFVSKFICQICKEEIAPTESKIRDHLWQNHCLTREFYIKVYESAPKNSVENSESISSSSLDDKLSCKICKYTTSRRVALNGHFKKYHEQSATTTCCKKKFENKWDIFVHLIENHEKEKDLYSKYQVWPGLEKYYEAK